MSDNLQQPLLIVNTQAQVAGQSTPSMTQSASASYAAGQTLNQTLVLRGGQQYAPDIGFSNLIITTTGPVQLLAALGSNPAYINQTVNQQTTIDTTADSFSITNTGTTSVTVKVTVVVIANNSSIPSGVVTSLNSMIGDLNIVGGAGVGVSAASQSITIENTGVLQINGQSGVVNINASTLPGLARVALTGEYGDLIGAPNPFTLPAATASILGGIKVGSGLVVTQDGTLSATGGSEGSVTSVNAQQGAVVVQAIDNQATNTQSLIANSGATTGNIVLNRLAVGGSGLAIGTSNGVVTITSSGLQGAVLTVNSQAPSVSGNAVIQAVDNIGNGTSLIQSNGATTGNLTFNKLLAGPNITIVPDVNGNLILSGAVTQYTLPPATATVIGGVKQGANVTIASDGTISVANPFVLSAATATNLGGVKIGSNVNVALDGTISVAAPYVLPAATTTALGGVKAGSNVTIAADGTISVPNTYTLPLATVTTIGGIKVGANLTIAGDGTLSANATPYTLPAASTTSLGGVIVGTNLSITDGVLSAAAYALQPATTTTLGGVKAGAGVAIAPDGTLSSVNPIATPEVLGSVKIGANVTVLPDGTISVTAPYALPVASATVLGGFMVGANLSITESGVLSATQSSYSLPVATSSVLGGVKQGSNVAIASDGTLSVAAPYALPLTTTTTLGGLIVGDNLTVDGNGRVSAGAPYTLPTASATVLGGVIVGSGLAINAGVLSVAYAAPVTSVSGQTGAVVVQAESANPKTGSVSLIENSGSTTGTITTKDLVAGAGVTIAPNSDGNLQISSVGLVSSVNGLTGAVTVQAVDNNTATGISLISDGGSTTGTVKLLRIVAGSNITLAGDSSGNLQISAAESAAYTLPAATTGVLGGVKIGSNISVASDGTISVAAPSAYTLPIAAVSVLGGVKIGSGLSVAGDGTLSVPSNGVVSLNGMQGDVNVSTIDANVASGVTLIADTGASTGIVKLLRIVAGSNIGLSNDVDGNLAIAATIPVATASTVGGVIAGTGVTIAGNGAISANVASVSGQTGAVVVSAVDNNDATGTSLISDGGSTTGTIKLNTLVAGSGTTIAADVNGNLVISAQPVQPTFSLFAANGSISAPISNGSSVALIGSSADTTITLAPAVFTGMVTGARVYFMNASGNNMIVSSAGNNFQVGSASTTNSVTVPAGTEVGMVWTGAVFLSV